jgi:hypothetical protein
MNTYLEMAHYKYLYIIILLTLKHKKSVTNKRVNSRMGTYVHSYGPCPMNEKSWKVTVKVRVHFE